MSKEIVQYLKKPEIEKRFSEVLNKNASSYVASLIQTIQTSDKLQKCDRVTILSAAMKAAALNLPIEQNLGFAYIIPYGKEAQFQIGYKGFIQLALRSGQIIKLNAIPVYEGQLKSFDPLTENLTFDFDNKKSDKIQGFAGYLELANGFNKTIFWDTEKMISHGKRYSKTYKFGPWQDDFEKMGLKTIIKNLLSKFAPLSTEIQEAIKFDQSVIRDNQPDYVDNDDFSDVPDLQDENPQARVQNQNTLFDKDGKVIDKPKK
jgi:recombination protein RecT